MEPLLIFRKRGGNPKLTMEEKNWGLLICALIKISIRLSRKGIGFDDLNYMLKILERTKLFYI